MSDRKGYPPGELGFGSKGVPVLRVLGIVVIAASTMQIFAGLLVLFHAQTVVYDEYRRKIGEAAFAAFMGKQTAIADAGMILEVGMVLISTMGLAAGLGLVRREVGGNALRIARLWAWAALAYIGVETVVYAQIMVPAMATMQQTVQSLLSSGAAPEGSRHLAEPPAMPLSPERLFSSTLSAMLPIVTLWLLRRRIHA